VFTYIHLTDLHLSAANSWDSEPVLEDLVRDVTELKEHSGLHPNFVFITGDLALSGKAEEYKIAKAFVEKLSQASEVPWDRWFCVPGNHDVDRSAVTVVAQTLKKQLLSSKDENALSKHLGDQTATEQLLLPLAQYLEFAPQHAKLSDRKPFYVSRLPGEDLPSHVSIIGLNSAILAFDEDPPFLGRRQVQEAVNCVEGTDFIIAIVHHPIAVLPEWHQQAINNILDNRCDLLLHGHTHSRRLEILSASPMRCSQISAGAIYPTSVGLNSYNITVVDFKARTATAYLRQYREDRGMWVEDNTYRRPKPGQFTWQLHTPEVVKQTPREAPEYNREKETSPTDVKEFANTKEYAGFLSDPGATFTHPICGVLGLNDIFVYSDVRELSFKKDSKATPYLIIEGEKLIDYASNNRYLVITGPDRAGKSCLLKVLYRDFQKKGLVPVLLQGGLLKATTEERLSAAVEAAFQTQYPQEKLPAYQTLKRNAKVLLIDDLDESPLNTKGKDALLGASLKLYGVVVISGSQTLKLELFTEQLSVGQVLSFRFCELMEFGHRLRARLIRKWLELGQEETISEAELTYEMRDAEQIVDTVLGRNLVPSHPIVILTIMQTREATIPLDVASGSLGYYYELLITQALSGQPRRPSMDTRYNYLSYLAYSMFNHKVMELAEQETAAMHQEYCSEFAMRFSLDRIISDFERANIIVKRKGALSFKYKYLYYYFIARYMRDNLRRTAHETKVRAQISGMCEKVYREDYANILIFLCYLSKDPLILEEMAKTAGTIYLGHDPCDMRRDVEFLEKLNPNVPGLVLMERDPDEAREESLKTKDQLEREREGEEVVEDSEESGEAVRLVNSSLKTIQILGQVLRNFPGSLPAQVKFELAKECYMLGLRTLSALLKAIEDGLNQLKKALADELAKAEDIRDREAAMMEARRFLFFLTESLAFGIIKEISHSIGSEELAGTLEEVLNRSPSPAVSLIDISIKLDHYREVPKKEIVELYEEVEKNIFTATLLKFLVLERFYFYPCDYRTRQSICSHLRISIRSPKFLDNPSQRS